VVAGVIGLILFLIFLLAIFLPMTNTAVDTVPPSLPWPGFNMTPLDFP
jgi:hypothetical protein